MFRDLLASKGQAPSSQFMDKETKKSEIHDAKTFSPLSLSLDKETKMSFAPQNQTMEDNIDITKIHFDYPLRPPSLINKVIEYIPQSEPSWNCDDRTSSNVKLEERMCWYCVDNCSIDEDDPSVRHHIWNRDTLLTCYTCFMKPTSVTTYLCAYTAEACSRQGCICTCGPHAATVACCVTNKICADALTCVITIPLCVAYCCSSCCVTLTAPSSRVNTQVTELINRNDFYGLFEILKLRKNRMMIDKNHAYHILNFCLQFNERNKEIKSQSRAQLFSWARESLLGSRPSDLHPCYCSYNAYGLLKDNILALLFANTPDANKMLRFILELNTEKYTLCDAKKLDFSLRDNFYCHFFQPILNSLLEPYNKKIWTNVEFLEKWFLLNEYIPLPKDPKIMKIINAILSRQAFCMGLFAKTASPSSIKKFQQDPIFDINTVSVIFDFASDSPAFQKESILPKTSPK